MPELHARLSPSASSIWLYCPGAFPLIERMGIKEIGPRIYADKGTAMHTVAEKCLTENREPEEFVNEIIPVGSGRSITIEKSMLPIVKMFVDYMRSLPKDGFIAYEQKVQIPSSEDLFGTADGLAVYTDPESFKLILEIVDLKTGSNPVEVVKNTQLMIYAIGAYEFIGKFFGVDEIKITIIQPVLGPPKSYSFGLGELSDFHKTVEAAVVRVREEPNVFVPSEKSCRWCKAKNVCPAIAKIKNEAAALDFKDVPKMEKDDLGMWYGKISILKLAIKAIEEETKKRLIEGQKIKGFRLAPGTVKREWKDPEILKKDLADAGFDEEVFMVPSKLKSPAQLEETLEVEGIEFDFKEYLNKDKEAQPVIVPEDSLKPFWSSTEAARADFSK